MSAWRLIPILVIAIMCEGCATKSALSDQDQRAVALAEAFVLSNGYTSRPPSIRFEQLTPELWDNEISKEEVQAYRRNYLEPRALGFIRDDGGWLIVFKVTDAAVLSRQDIFPFSPIGRYVSVNRKLRVGSLVHAWADPADRDMVKVNNEE